MAASLRSTPNAFPAEVARYLAVEPADVLALIEKANLPALRIPKATRAVIRIPLRDFHHWLQKRASNDTPKLSNYDTFLADFDDSIRTRSPKGQA